MTSWWDAFQHLMEQLAAMPELIALVCLFVLNNALWMRHLALLHLQGTGAVWEAVRRLEDLTIEIQGLKELLEFQSELWEEAIACEPPPCAPFADNL